jgi:hypothetical protein
MGTSTNDGDSQPAHLRELARRIQEEPDTSKLIELVEQLIAKFDESRLKRLDVVEEK